jgi:NAD(P)-dependent dehydrogenase (short-subunit alcohol dehydrogenase family)
MFSAHTAVVTGASAGVGRATAVALGRRGWKVGLLARGIEGLQGARAEVEAAGGEGLAIVADVADAAAVFRAAQTVENTWEHIDLWINNAMATVFSEFEDLTPEEFRRVTEVTYLGQVHGTMAALRHMQPRGRGTIVQVGSALAYRSIPLQSAYCGAKAAVRGFTDSLRSELQRKNNGISLTMVHLPAVNTPQFDWARTHLRHRPRPLPPIYQPEWVAEQIVEAAFSKPRELWLGGSVAKAILGNAIAPGRLDRILASKGYEGQTMTEQLQPNRPDNLFAVVQGDFGTRGSFDRSARDRASSFHPAALRAALAAAGVTASAALGALAARLTAKR